MLQHQARDTLRRVLHRRYANSAHPRAFVSKLARSLSINNTQQNVDLERGESSSDEVDDADDDDDDGNSSSSDSDNESTLLLRGMVAI
jgi:hypothetical protein